MRRISVLPAAFLAAIAMIIGGPTVALASPAHGHSHQNNQQAVTVYNAIPGTLPPNMASLGFQATQTAEFGDYVNLDGTARNLQTVTVTMSDWAKASDYPALPASGWVHPITINVYSAVPGTPLNTVGPLLGTITQNVTIPWRPEADPTCPGGTAWRSASDGQCYNGIDFNAKIDLSSLHLTLPDAVIIGVAYNTNTWGYNPIGQPGPYESLNVGVEGSATIGTDVDTDAVFWNTMTPGNFTDGGAGGVGVFREDTNWTPYGTVALKVTASGPKVGHKGCGHKNKHNGRDGHHHGRSFKDR